MNISQQILKPSHPCRPGGNYKKTSITIHSTGNPKSTAQNERAWLDNPSNKRQASWHYVIGEDIVIQAIPDKEEAWHCAKSEGNRCSISIEIIESGDRKKVLETAAEFAALKLLEYNFTLENIKKHFDWSGKNCPRILIDNTLVVASMDWDYFMNRVQAYLNNEEKEEEKEEEPVENRFQTVAELPDWAKPTIQKLVNEGKIANGSSLDLTMDMTRILVITDR